MKHVESDSESGAEIYQLIDDPRPADNIYGEQPYSSADGSRVVIRFFATDERDGELAILDLNDGSLHTVLNTQPRFPAFHAWSDYLYYQEPEDDRLLLKRCHFHTLEQEEVAALPAERGRFSYGTVSPDHRYYAVSIDTNDDRSEVLLIDLQTGAQRTLINRDDYLFKHEQFALDGSNRVMIQANRMPDVKEVHLGILEAEREGTSWFAADRPHTPRPTGHEAWIGRTDGIFFSTAADSPDKGNVWVTSASGSEAEAVTDGPPHYGHVGMSRCGRYWIGDVFHDDAGGVPIDIGSLESGGRRRLVFSRTIHDGNQWAHTHPYMTADNRWLIYNSTRSGHPQVYAARVPEAFLADL